MWHAKNSGCDLANCAEV